jgi:hypothetical protein
MTMPFESHATSIPLFRTIFRVYFEGDPDEVQIAIIFKKNHLYGSRMNPSFWKPSNQPGHESLMNMNLLESSMEFHKSKCTESPKLFLP